MPVLIARTDKVGDLVLATPAAELIKKAMPYERVIFLCSSYAQEVLEDNPYIDEVIAIDRNASPFEIAKRLKPLNISIAIVLFPTLNVSLGVFLAGIPVRCSTGFRWYQFLFNKLTYLRRSKCMLKEWEYNVLLVQIGIPTLRSLTAHPKVFPSERDVERAERLLAGKKRPIILIYPGGGKELRWPKEHFKRLCILLEAKGATPVVTVGKNEEHMISEFKRWAIDRVLSLGELAALMKLCDVVVSNNTGPMHIAAALKRPLIQIFDPRWAVNPKRWGHNYTGASVLRPPLPFCNGKCKNCKYRPCMEMITVENVYKEIERCLGRRL